MIDTDLDSYPDAWEVRNGFDPTDPHVSYFQTVFTTIPLLIVGIVVELVTIPVLYRRLLAKRKSAELEGQQDYEKRVSKEFKELVDSIDGPIDTDD
jgi:hypothetical protein